MNKKVAIIGLGWVGKAMLELFPDAYVYSHNIIYVDGKMVKTTNDQEWEEKKEQYQKEVNKCDVAFVCVPTPCPHQSKLDTRGVEEVVEWLHTDLIVIRSTMNPGDCDFLKVKYEKNICMQPEYLGETPNHPLLNTKNTPFLIIGGDKSNREKLIELYTTVYNANVSIRQVSNYAAEIIKLTENRAIAWKVAQAQELYDVCKAHNIDYYTVRDAVYGDDPRFNKWWTFIYPDKRGFNSKCIPKDIYAWVAWAESAGYTPEITRAILERNEKWINPPLPASDKKVN